MRFFLPVLIAFQIALVAAEPDAPPSATSGTFDFDSLSKATGILPIPKGKARDAAAESARKLAYYKRLYIEPAKARMKDAPYAEAAAAFLDHAADYLSSVPGALAKPIAMEGYPLYQQGCKDPLYYVIMGDLAATIGNESAPWYSNAYSEAEKDSALYGGVALWARSRMPNLNVKGETARAQLLAWFKQTLTKENLREAEAEDSVSDQLTVLELMFESGFEVEMAKAFEESALPRWAKSTLVGILEIEIAWKFRGGGWASTVTEKGFEGFRVHLTKAREELTWAWKENPEQPFAATGLIAVTMGLDSSNIQEVQRWFHRAVEAQFDAEPAYGKFMNAIQPKWGGSWTHVLAFGEACMDTDRHDTSVPHWFIKALSSIADQIPDWQHLYGDPEIRKRLARYFDRSIELITDAKAKAHEKGLAAVFAWLGGDYERAANLMETGTIPLDSGAADWLHRVDVGTTTMLSESRIFASPAREDFLAARDARVNEKWDDATAAYVRARAKAPKAATRYIDGEISLLEFERKLSTGQWTKVPLLLGHAGWSRLSGSWYFTDGNMQMRSASKAARVVFEGVIPARFEMRGRYTVSPMEDKKTRDFSILFGHSALQVSPREKGWFGFQFWLRGDGKSSIELVRNRARPNATHTKVMAIPDTGTFVLQRSKKTVSFSLNDEPVFTDFAAPPYDAAENPHIGFGNISAPSDQTVDFSEIEIRRLGDDA